MSVFPKGSFQVVSNDIGPDQFAANREKIKKMCEDFIANPTPARAATPEEIEGLFSPDGPGVLPPNVFILMEDQE